MIAEPDVDPRQKIDTHYTLAQLYMMQENYPFAARQLEIWMASSDVVSNDGKILLAQVYYELDKKPEALILVNQAIDSVSTKGHTPKESWWVLQKVLYYEQAGNKNARNKKYNNKKVISILKQLITHYTKQLYWHQLGGMYGQMEENSHRLASLDILYLDKALTKSRDLLSLAYLYLGADVPYRAAQIIEQGIEQKNIEENAKNLELLGGVWQQARETQKALEPLKQAAEKSETGETWSRLAMVYLDLDENTQAVNAAKNALKKGQLKYPSYTQITLGNALVNLNCYRKAAEVFGTAAKYKKSQKTAKQWQTYVLGEADRRDSLIESGAEINGCQLL
jgi:tetratricopeptide (TPR) repeat protein